MVCITNEDGEEEWVKAALKERKPFLDDDDKPIVNEVVAEEEEAPKTPKKRKTAKVEE